MKNAEKLVLYQRLMVTGTACLCLLVLVPGLVIGVVFGKIDASALGKLSGASTATGFVAFMLILYWMIS